jgi:hypothetical protein
MSLALTQAVLEIERYVSNSGWDQQARLFALVDTHQLVEAEPQLAAQLGLAADPDAPDTLTPIEQDEIPPNVPVDEFLAQIAWPEAIVGCALVIERLMLPPAAETKLPNTEDDRKLATWVAEHPDREEVRITVGVTRAGESESAIRLRSKDSETEVLSGASLVPGLADALRATFAG